MMKQFREGESDPSTALNRILELLITTNKSVRDWTELLTGDEVLTAAILVRLLHNAHVINIKGRSYQLCDLDHALGERVEVR